MESQTPDLSGRIVLVTGANGFIGTHLCAHLEALGASVRRATRAAAGRDTFAVGDIGGETDWGEALAGADTVFHLAARAHLAKDTAADPLAEYRRVNVDATRGLAESANAAGVRRFVLLSSTAVLGQESDQALDESALPRPQTRYGRSKLEAEDALLQVAATGTLEPVIVRAPPVYGPGNPGKFQRLISGVRTGLPLPLARASNERSWLFVGNLTDLLVVCAVHPAAAGETFLASDGEDVSTAQLTRMIGSAMGRRVVLLPVPRWLLVGAARAVGKSRDIRGLFAACAVNSHKARELLDWEPPYSLAQGLAQTVL